MRQRRSPLLHDYKPELPRNRKNSKALQWFGVGLGIPLIALALITTFDADRASAPPAEQAEMLPTDEFDPALEFASAVAIDDSLATLAEPDPVPLPDYDTLTLKIGRGDTLDRLFRKHDLNLGHLAAIARLDEPKQIFRRLKPGDEFDVIHDNGSVVSMYSALDLTSALSIERGEDGFEAAIIERPIELRKRIAHGVIESSLFESGADAGLSDRTIMNIAGIFAWDVDFVLDIRRGDSYFVQYEEIWQDGEFVSDGEIVVAEFNNNGRTHRAIRFIDDNGRSDYYTPDGDSVRKAFIRAPVDFTRISSNFNPRRRHPILNSIRAHRGVDYAAPRGTPIKAAGDGKVIFRGVKNGYGKTIILQHGGNITTLYAHMSGFASTARIGARVRQGQTIGYVGATGLATANHLHYEYRLNGVHRNPRTVELPKASPIDEKYRERFLATVEPILEELETFKRSQVATIAYGTQ